LNKTAASVALLANCIVLHAYWCKTAALRYASTNKSIIYL